MLIVLVCVVLRVLRRHGKDVRPTMVKRLDEKLDKMAHVPRWVAGLFHRLPVFNPNYWWHSPSWASCVSLLGSSAFFFLFGRSIFLGRRLRLLC